MSGEHIPGRKMRGSLAVWFAAFALAARLLVPFGFMPVSGQGYAITLCTGDGMVAAWVDDSGKVHKERKAPGGNHDRPCAFAGIGGAVAAAGLPDIVPPTPIFGEESWPHPASVSIGYGLAAPPPPSTGPPNIA